MKSSDNILGHYMYGSVVYGTNGEKSDTDYIIVDSDQIIPERKEQTPSKDFTIYSEEKFKQMLDEHDIAALECMFLPEKLVSVNKFTMPEISLPKLRASISRTASNSFVKCKKKLIVEHDYYIGKKSLWHSLRILMFGIQIAKHGKIVDYSEANSLWSEIVLCDKNDWNYYKDKYKQLHNQLSTEFRKLAPKE